MPRLDATTRLNRRGIIAWRVDGVLARLTAKQSGKDDGLRNQVVQVIVSAGADAAVKIRRRVMQDADLAGQAFPGYSQRWSQGAGVALDYARKAGASGESWESPRAFHQDANTREGTYNVTGGMWKGIQARGTGESGVIIDFAGSSAGSGGEQWIEASQERIYMSENVRNAWKARAIFDKHKVHVLKMTNEELQAMGLRVTRQFSSWLGLQLKR
jgi:hypothetical protein